MRISAQDDTEPAEVINAPISRTPFEKFVDAPDQMVVGAESIYLVQTRQGFADMSGLCI